MRRRLGPFHAPRTLPPSSYSLPIGTSRVHRHFTSTVDHRVAATYQWFDTVVVGQKLCPFAPPFQQSPDLMRVVVCDPPAPSDVDGSTDWRRKRSIEFVKKEIHDLVGDAAVDTSSTANIGNSTSTIPPRNHETTLVILENPEWSQDFQEFIRFSWDLQEQAIVQANLVGILQLVLFHPLATHQTYGRTMVAQEEEEEDATTTTTTILLHPGDYTIRSPYPTVHLLREVDVLGLSSHCRQHHEANGEDV